MSRHYERMSNFRYRYPRSLRTLAHEYVRVQVYRYREWLDMTTVVRDLRRELGRVERHRRQYHRQQREILRLRLIVRSLKDERGNVSLIKKQSKELEVQRSRIRSMEKTLRDLRHHRSSLYRDWRSTHKKCSELTQLTLSLKSENENMQSQLIAIKKCLSA